MIRNRKTTGTSPAEHREIVAGRGRKIRWTLGLLRPYRTRIIFMTLAVLASTASALAPPYLAGRAIDSGIEAGDISALNLTIALFVVAIIVNAVTSWLQTWLVGWVGIRVLQDLREQVFKHIQRMSIGFFNRNRPGTLISRMTNDIEALNQLISDGIVTLFANLLTLFGSLLLVSGKRSGERAQVGTDGSTRRVQTRYTDSYLQFVREFSAAGLLMAYGLMAYQKSEVANGAAEVALQVSIIPFLATIMLLVQRMDSGGGGTPEDLVLHDHAIQAAGAIWAITFCLGVYLGSGAVGV